jgi:hypothetical protein
MNHTFSLNVLKLQFLIFSFQIGFVFRAAHQMGGLGCSQGESPVGILSFPNGAARPCIRKFIPQGVCLVDIFFDFL